MRELLSQVSTKKSKTSLLQGMFPLNITTHHNSLVEAAGHMAITDDQVVPTHRQRDHNTPAEVDLKLSNGNVKTGCPGNIFTRIDCVDNELSSVDALHILSQCAE